MTCRLCGKADTPQSAQLPGGDRVLEWDILGAEILLHAVCCRELHDRIVQLVEEWDA